MTTFRLNSRVLASTDAAHRSSPTPQAIPVPWRVTRRNLGVIELEHRGRETAHSVRFTLAGAGMLGLSLPRNVEPCERLRVVVRGAHADEASAAPDALLVLRWFQGDGTELLWPIVL